MFTGLAVKVCVIPTQFWENTMAKDIETGMFYDRDTAAAAADHLHDWGYTSEDVSVMSRSRDDAEKFAHEHGARSTAAGAVTGAAVGGGLGAIVAGLMATGSIIAIAGTGGAALPIVAGPLAAALAGLGVGGVAGGLVGALVGLGIPEHKAKEYETGLNRGGLILGVQPRDENDRARIRELFLMEPVTDDDIERVDTRDTVRTAY